MILRLYTMCLMLVAIIWCYPLKSFDIDERKPNIILIFIDDMGWPALSCYGNKQIDTGNIDRLAREGMKFTDAYVTPQCTPSRASLLTGQHTARNRLLWLPLCQSARTGVPIATATRHLYDGESPAG
jgi:arylsulfatase A-like enzyme